MNLTYISLIFVTFFSFFNICPPISNQKLSFDSCNYSINQLDKVNKKIEGLHLKMILKELIYSFNSLFGILCDALINLTIVI